MIEYTERKGEFAKLFDLDDVKKVRSDHCFQYCVKYAELT